MGPTLALNREARCPSPEGHTLLLGNRAVVFTP
jgi:hypothetical protein